MQTDLNLSYERKRKSNTTLYVGLAITLLLFASCGGLIRYSFLNTQSRANRPVPRLTILSLEATPALSSVKMSAEVQQRLSKPINIVGSVTETGNGQLHFTVRGPNGSATVLVTKSGTLQTRDYQLKSVDVTFDDGSSLSLQELVRLQYDQ
jgi:hypothetical protein